MNIEPVDPLEEMNTELQTIRDDIKDLTFAIDRLAVCMFEMTKLIEQVAARHVPGVPSGHRGKDNDDSR
jgi:hypothetical protein